jgi:hypothetical protein
MSVRSLACARCEASAALAPSRLHTHPPSQADDECDASLGLRAHVNGPAQWAASL